MEKEVTPRPPRRTGAKPKPIAERFLPRTINMTMGQADKLDQLGGPAWVRAQINKAKLPTA